jgi:acetyl-CoA carboxylase carboxyltransferase component
MNSKDLGADFVFAWPSAQLGVMGSKQAVEIIHRREIAAADDPERARDALAAHYAGEHLHSGAATREGFVDEVVPPSETRDRVADALNALDTATLRRAPAGNIPL